ESGEHSACSFEALRFRLTGIVCEHVVKRGDQLIHFEAPSTPPLSLVRSVTASASASARSPDFTAWFMPNESFISGNARADSNPQSAFLGRERIVSEQRPQAAHFGERRRLSPFP